MNVAEGRFVLCVTERVRGLFRLATSKSSVSISSMATHQRTKTFQMEYVHGAAFPCQRKETRFIICHTESSWKLGSWSHKGSTINT